MEIHQCVAGTSVPTHSHLRQRQGHVCSRASRGDGTVVSPLSSISLTAGAVQVNELSPHTCKLKPLNPFPFHCRPEKYEFLCLPQPGDTDASCTCNSLLSCQNLILCFRPETPVSKKGYGYITVLSAENKLLR